MEKDLEHYLFEHLRNLVSTDLFVIGQSSPYQPEVDLLALDAAGDLWLFELKRERSSSDNLLQVLRYSQSYSELSIDGLSGIFERFTGVKTRSLAVAFCEYFGYGEPSAPQEWGGRIGRSHHLVVVTDGADDETIAAVNHWQRHGVDIQIWPFRIYAWSANSFGLELPELYIKGRRISTSLPGIFVVNTNRTYNAASEPYMLQHGVALATAQKWDAENQSDHGRLPRHVIWERHRDSRNRRRDPTPPGQQFERRTNALCEATRLQTASCAATAIEDQKSCREGLRISTYRSRARRSRRRTRLDRSAET